MSDMAMIRGPEYHPYLTVPWHVPSESEVNLATSSILNFINAAPQSAFHSMLQRVWNCFDPQIWRRLVSSLLQDQAVWTSIMNNQTFQELQGRLFRLNAPAIEGTLPETISDYVSSGLARFIIRWVLDNTMLIISELMNQLGSILGNIQTTVNGTGLRLDNNSMAALIVSLIITIVVTMAFRAFLRGRVQNRT